MKARATKTKTGSFVMHRRDLLESCAWRVLTIQARRLLDRIELEHLRRGGKHNGSLKVTYDGFRDHGVGKRGNIVWAIAQAEALGLIEVTHGGRGAVNEYRLTYLPSPAADATDEWRAVTDIEDAKRRVAVGRRKQSGWLKAARAANVVPFNSKERDHD